MATCTIEAISPPSTVSIAAPENLFRLRVDYDLGSRGRNSSLSSARAIQVAGIFATRTFFPCARASFSVNPIRPSCGSINTVAGTIRPAMLTRFLSSKLAATPDSRHTKCG